MAVPCLDGDEFIYFHLINPIDRITINYTEGQLTIIYVINESVHYYQLITFF